jgi:hypothetical protein
MAISRSLGWAEDEDDAESYGELSDIEDSITDEVFLSTLPGGLFILGTMVMLLAAEIFEKK